MAYIFAWAVSDCAAGCNILAGSLDAPVAVADYRTPEEEAALAEELGFAQPAIIRMADYDEWMDAIAANPDLFGQFLDKGAVVLLGEEIEAQFSPTRASPRPVVLEIPATNDAEVERMAVDAELAAEQQRRKFEHLQETATVDFAREFDFAQQIARKLGLTDEEIAELRKAHANGAALVEEAEEQAS